MGDKLQKRKSFVSVQTEPMITTMVSVKMPLETAEYILDVLDCVVGKHNGPVGKISEVRTALREAGLKTREPRAKGHLKYEDT